MSTESPVDPRGPRFAAWLTSIVLAIVLLTEWWPLLASQAVVFGVAAFIGLRFSPYSMIYRHVVAPRLAPPTEREDTAPLRFAQGIGFSCAVLGTVGYALDLGWLGITPTAIALIAALLNAAFGFCVGCETYLLLRRLELVATPSRPT